jgi:hypothetical protein
LPRCTRWLVISDSFSATIDRTPVVSMSALLAGS